MEQVMPQVPIQTKMQIVEKIPLNHDCYIYKFKFAGQSFQLRIGQHFKIKETIKTIEHPEGEQVQRKYTPISPCSQKDTFDVLFKIYRPNQNPNFPHGGKLTPYIQSLNVGDKINVKGPYGRFGYQNQGTIVIDGQKIPTKKIFFMAGGSGITPCYQTIKQIASMKDENIEMILLFANKSSADIVLKKQLEQMGNRVKLHYIIDNGDESWKGYKGYITKQILHQICPLNQKDTMYVHCGPFLMNKLIRQIFSEHYPQSRIFKY